MTRTLGWLAALVPAMAIAGAAGAQVKTANPATAWVYTPNVTVNELWRGVQDGQIQVVSSAAATDPRGGMALVTVFQGQGRVWRCVERTDPNMVERHFACARVR